MTLCADPRSGVDMLIIASKDEGRIWGGPRKINRSVRADGKIREFFGMVDSPRASL